MQQINCDSDLIMYYIILLILFYLALQLVACDTGSCSY